MDINGTDPEGTKQMISTTKIQEDIDLAYKLMGGAMYITLIATIILYFVSPDIPGEPFDIGGSLNLFFLMLVGVSVFSIVQVKMILFKSLFGGGVIDLRNMDPQEIMGQQNKVELPMGKARSIFFGKMVVLCAFPEAVMIYGLVFLILSLSTTSVADPKFAIFVVIALLFWNYTGRLKDSIEIKQ